MTINLFTCPVAATNQLNASEEDDRERAKKSRQNKLLIERKMAFVIFIWCAGKWQLDIY